MEEQMPPNLDDGELWLPSDVINAVGVRRYRLAAMDDLAQKLASLQLLNERRAIPAVKPFKDCTFYPKERPFTMLTPANGGFNGGFSPVLRAVHKSHHALPVDFHVEMFRMARARVLQRQRELNRRTSGTGVFLPRVYRVDSNKKKPLIVKGNDEFQQVLGKQTVKYLPSSEMCLPQDWTY